MEESNLILHVVQAISMDSMDIDENEQMQILRQPTHGKKKKLFRLSCLLLSLAALLSGAASTRLWKAAEDELELVPEESLEDVLENMHMHSNAATTQIIDEMMEEAGHNVAVGMDDPKENLLAKAPDHLIKGPFVVITEGGCSGTTAIGQYIQAITNAHGFEYFHKMHFEFMHTEKNPRHNKTKNEFYHDIQQEMEISGSMSSLPITVDQTDEMMLESVRRAHQEAKALGQLTFFKANFGQFKVMEQGYQDLGATFAGVYRENILDRCICMVKDCFHAVQDYGYPVFGKNGTKTDLCISRRQHPEVRVKAKFKSVTGCIYKSLKPFHYIKRLRFPSVSSESLFEFEISSDEDALKRSVDAWMIFLHPYLQDKLDESLILKVLAPDRNTRKSSPQKHGIYNYQKVKDDLLNTDWAVYLRDNDDGR